MLPCSIITAPRRLSEGQANKPIVVSVIFQPGNEMGQAEKKPIVIKNYTFKPVN